MINAQLLSNYCPLKCCPLKNIPHFQLSSVCRLQVRQTERENGSTDDPQLWGEQRGGVSVHIPGSHAPVGRVSSSACGLSQLHVFMSWVSLLLSPSPNIVHCQWRMFKCCWRRGAVIASWYFMKRSKVLLWISVTIINPLNEDSHLSRYNTHIAHSMAVHDKCK